MQGMIVKLTALTGKLEYIKVQSIAHMREVEASAGGAKQVPAHTDIYLDGRSEPIQVVETVGFIMQLASQHSNTLQWVKQ